MSDHFIPSEEMTFNTVPNDRLRLKRYLTQERQALCLDLNHVIKCDSAGLAFLIEAKRLSVNFNRSFKLLNIPRTVQNLAEFCGVNTLLDISVGLI